MWRRLLDRLRRRRQPLEGAGKIAEGESRAYVFETPGEPARALVVCRVGGRLHALDARCPHAGGRIADGPLMDGRWAFCPLHQYLFDPRTGRQQHDWCGRALRYRVVERGGRSYVLC